MQVTSINTTKLLGSQVIAGQQYSNPTNVAAQVLLDFGTIVNDGTSRTLLASVPLPDGATITDMWISTTGTGTIWTATPSWLVSIDTTSTQPATGNLVNGLASTISAFGQAQSLSRSSWVTYQNGLEVTHGSVVYLYVASGIITPTTATARFNVEYYIKP